MSEDARVVVACVASALAGGAAAWAYMALLRRQVAGVAAGRPSSMLLGFLVRMAVFGVPLAAAMWYDQRVGIAFAVGFVLPRALWLRRLRNADA
jgi:hypothetical protein